MLKVKQFTLQENALSVDFALCMFVFACCVHLCRVIVATPSSYTAEHSTVSSNVFVTDLSDDSDDEWDVVKSPDDLNSPVLETKVMVHYNQNNRKKSLASMRSVTSSKESYPALPPVSEEEESENEALMSIKKSSFQDRITFRPLPSKRYSPPAIIIDKNQVDQDSLGDSPGDSPGLILEFEETKPLHRTESVASAGKNPGTISTSSTQTNLSIPSFFSNIFSKSNQSIENPNETDTKTENLEMNDISKNTSDTILEIPVTNVENVKAENCVRPNGSDINGMVVVNETETSDKQSASDCAVM